MTYPKDVLPVGVSVHESRSRFWLCVLQHFVLLMSTGLVAVFYFLMETGSVKCLILCCVSVTVNVESPSIFALDCRSSICVSLPVDIMRAEVSGGTSVNS